MSPARNRAAVLLLALAAVACRPAAPEKPNVILFLVDDMGWMDSSAYGSTYYETPNMERLAAQGMRFTDAYATPLCSPTRASILTGKHSARHGVTRASGDRATPPASPCNSEAGRPSRLICPESRRHLDPSEYTLAEALRDAGYRTGHFGKWHLGTQRPSWPDRAGFGVAFHGVPDDGPPRYFSPYGFSRQSFRDGPPGEYITDRLTDEALRFVAESGDRPFFLNLWHYGVHAPWGHKPEYTRVFASKTDPRGKQGNPIMASMLKSIDDSLGRILDQLEELGLAERTIVVLYSDNGGNTHSNSREDSPRLDAASGDARSALLRDWRVWAGGLPPTNNAPLRDGKARLYEGGIRVPLIVAWPGVVPGGSTSDAVVGPIDLYPTLLELIGVPLPEMQTMDGRSFAPVLNGTGELRREAYFTWFPHFAPGVAVRRGDWKLIRRFAPTPEYPSGFELFDLREDLGETRNLADAMPEKVRELDRLIDEFVRETGARAPEPNPVWQADPPVARAEERSARP
jgi:arylsulfatase A-like enzyme